MNRTSFIIGLLAVTMVTGNVLAKTPQQTCDEKKNAVTDLENKLKDKENQIKDVDNKIDAAQKQLDALNAEKALKKGEADKMKRDVTQAKRDADAACASVDKCEGYKKQLGEYRSEFTDLKAELAKLDGQIKAKTAQLGVLEKKVLEYQSSYSKLGCGSLVAGETAQATIDQCNQIFSSWNAEQKAIDDLNGELGRLKGQFARLMSKLNVLRKKIAILRTEYAKNCTGDAGVKEAEDMEKDDAGTGAMNDELNKAKDRVKAIQKIRIMKPVIKKGAKKPGKATDDGATAPEKKPDPAQKTEAEKKPDPAQKPEATKKPEAVQKPVATKKPVAAQKPVTTPKPAQK